MFAGKVHVFGCCERSREVRECVTTVSTASNHGWRKLAITSPRTMQVYSLVHPNAPAKRTQAGQRVCTAVKSVSPCRIWRVRPDRSVPAPQRRLQRRVATPCRATLQAGAGVNTRAEGEYPQCLNAFCLGLKKFGSARFCAGACDQRRIDRADWRGHGHYGRIMTTELEPPAPPPIHSRAGWFNAGHTSRYFCSKIDASTLAELLETIHDAFQTMKAFPELSPINRPV